MKNIKENGPVEKKSIKLSVVGLSGPISNRGHVLGSQRLSTHHRQPTPAAPRTITMTAHARQPSSLGLSPASLIPLRLALRQPQQRHVSLRTACGRCMDT